MLVLYRVQYNQAIPPIPQKVFTQQNFDENTLSISPFQRADIFSFLGIPDIFCKAWIQRRGSCFALPGDDDRRCGPNPGYCFTSQIRLRTCGPVQASAAPVLEFIPR